VAVDEVGSVKIGLAKSLGDAKAEKFLKEANDAQVKRRL
jgi:hypothetical protein